jgi:MGT family glycosyltransferase
MSTLAHAVQALGHEVVFLGMPDAEELVRSCGLEFVPVAGHMFPKGEMARRARHLSQLSGSDALAYTMELYADGARAVLEDGPRALAEMRPDALVLDATQTGLNLIALQQGLPFVHVCNALHFDLSGHTPFCVFPWPYEDTPEARARNQQGLQGFASAIASLNAIRKDYVERNRLGIDPDDPDAAISRLAWITQCPKEFDFPGDHYPEYFHYAGPMHARSLRPDADFPWERLTGEPLIYASMGTLQNGSERIFQTIVAAAEAPGRQLVLSIGRNLDPASIGSVAASTIVVRHAPQLPLLERASLCITHAGLNTTLESLSAGVPLVAIPIANDQHGVGARITYTGTGQVVPSTGLSVERLREAVEAVIAGQQYRGRARELQAAIQQTDGLNKAANIIDRVLRGAVELPIAHSPN